MTSADQRHVRQWLEGFTAQLITMALVIVSVVASTALVIEASRRERCVERWADATTSRSEVLTQAREVRDDALDELLVVAGGTDQQAKINAYQAYLRASATYRQTVGDHPPPPPPRLRC